MTSPNMSRVANQIADLFDELNPEEALDSPALWNAIQQFVRRDGKNSQNRLRTKLQECIRVKGKSRSKTRGPMTEVAAYNFFLKRRSGNGTTLATILSLCDTVTEIREAASEAAMLLESLRTGLMTKVALGVSREARLVERIDQQESGVLLIETQRALTLVLMEYEIRRLKGESKSEEDAEITFTSNAGITLQKTQNLRRTARIFSYILARKDGCSEALGWLPLVMRKNPGLWLHRMTLENAKLILDYCETREPTIIETVKMLHISVLRLLEVEFLQFAGASDLRELQQPNHMLSKYFPPTVKQAAQAPEPPQVTVSTRTSNPLATLAVAAAAAEGSSNSGNSMAEASSLFVPGSEQHPVTGQTFSGDAMGVNQLLGTGQFGLNVNDMNDMNDMNGMLPDYRWNWEDSLGDLFPNTQGAYA